MTRLGEVHSGTMPRLAISSLSRGRVKSATPTPRSSPTPPFSVANVRVGGRRGDPVGRRRFHAGVAASATPRSWCGRVRDRYFGVLATGRSLDEAPQADDQPGWTSDRHGANLARGDPRGHPVLHRGTATTRRHASQGSGPPVSLRGALGIRRGRCGPSGSRGDPSFPG